MRGRRRLPRAAGCTARAARASCSRATATAPRPARARRVVALSPCRWSGAAHGSPQRTVARTAAARARRSLRLSLVVSSLIAACRWPTWPLNRPWAIGTRADRLERSQHTCRRGVFAQARFHRRARTVVTGLTLPLRRHAAALANGASVHLLALCAEKPMRRPEDCLYGL